MERVFDESWRGGMNSGGVGMASFGDFPVEIQKRAASYLQLTSRSRLPEVSNVGTKGSETSELTESSENTESKERQERSLDLFRGPR
jgi:hypothetical protein